MRRTQAPPPGVGGASPILTVLPRVADGDLGLRALALAVDSLDLDLIGHKGGSVGHHQEGVAHDLLLPGPLRLLRAPLHAILNLGGVPLHPPQRLERESRRGAGWPRAPFPPCDPLPSPASGPWSLGQPGGAANIWVPVLCLGVSSAQGPPHLPSDDHVVGLVSFPLHIHGVLLRGCKVTC